MPDFFIDIETVGSQAPGEFDRVLAEIKPPATYKKPESIAQWMRDEAPTVAEETWRKQALSPVRGEIVAIGVATADSDPEVFARAVGESEAVLLQQFFGHVDQLLEQASYTGPDGRAWPTAEPYFIGHCADFDLRFVRSRAWVHGVRPNFKLPPADARVGKHYGDTSAMWAGLRERVSLRDLCLALGLPDPKAETSGSDVLDLWRAGDLDRIKRYCAGDVIACRACWRRMHWQAAA